MHVLISLLLLPHSAVSLLHVPFTPPPLKRWNFSSGCRNMKCRLESIEVHSAHPSFAATFRNCCSRFKNTLTFSAAITYSGNMLYTSIAPIREWASTSNSFQFGMPVVLFYMFDEFGCNAHDGTKGETGRLYMAFLVRSKHDSIM